MKFPRESVFRVGGAMLLGAGLVGGAFVIQKKAAADEETPVLVVARGDVRTVQPALDTDEDGFPDWEETLRGTDPRAYTTAEEMYPADATSSEPYTPPTTITDRFAERFLENMIRTGAGEPMTEEQKARLVEESVNTLSAETADRLYTRGDITIVADNDTAALHTYGNALGELFLTPSVAHEPELIILGKAVQANDPAVLDGLKPIEAAYAGMLRAVLLLETPSGVAAEQVGLVNALSLVRADIAAMQEVFTDPLGSLMRIRRYEDDARGLAFALDNIRIALEKNSIAYTSEEPGLIFFSLRP